MFVAVEKLTDFLSAVIPILFGSPKVEAFTADQIKLAAELKLLKCRHRLDELTDDQHIVVEWVPVVRIYEKSGARH